jgi:hypothetical protein
LLAKIIKISKFAKLAKAETLSFHYSLFFHTLRNGTQVAIPVVDGIGMEKTTAETGSLILRKCELPEAKAHNEFAESTALSLEKTVWSCA